MFELTNSQYLALQHRAELDQYDLTHVSFHNDLATVAKNHIKELTYIKQAVMPCLYEFPEPHTEPTLCTLIAYKVGKEERIIPIPHPRQFSDGIVLEYIDELQRCYEEDKRNAIH